MPVIGDQPNLNVKTVVFATDFSSASHNAGLYAAQLAAYFSATLLVAHAFVLSQPALEAEMAPHVVSLGRKNLQYLLSREVDHLKSGPVEVVSALLEGDPKHVIPELANQHEPSMIVLGTHGGGRFERDIIGSTAEQILRSTRWPSLTVGPHVQVASSKPLSMQRILFATDFTPAAANALIYAVSMAETFGARINILNVVAEEEIRHPGRLSDIQRRFYNVLDNLVPEQAREFCNARSFVEVGKAREQILAHIKEQSIDLLVLGIRNASYISLEMRTSRAFQIIVGAECPVLTIRNQ